jgi:hypothetical protein
MKITEEDRRALIDEAEHWVGVILSRALHGQAILRIDLKEGRVAGIRGGGEARRPRAKEKA